LLGFRKAGAGELAVELHCLHLVSGLNQFDESRVLRGDDIRRLLLPEALVELGDLALERGDPPAVVDEVLAAHAASLAERGNGVRRGPEAAVDSDR
jgi:hypothetical protein